MDNVLPPTSILKKELKFKWGGESTRLAVSDDAAEAKLLQRWNAHILALTS